MWTLDELGPRQAASETIDLVAGNAAALAELRTAIDRLDRVFDLGRAGPVWYANFAGRDNDPPEHRAIAERFAHETVVEFLTTLRTSLS